MITAHPEPFMSQVEELKPLLPLHWKELGIYQQKMPLDPLWSSYDAYERGGQLLYVPLRQAGRLIGYFIGLIAPGMHYQTTLTCKMDIAFVLPEFRKGGAGSVLFAAVKAELKRRGVKLWWVGSKDHHPIEGFYEAFGFERQETYFAMWIGDDDAA
jgi:GNAT superfamily N-acetyltransferase